MPSLLCEVQHTTSACAPVITFILGAAGGWFSRRWWFRFEKRKSLIAHLNGWRTEIENIDTTLVGATDRIWSVYRAGVTDVQRLSSISDFHKAAADAIYRVSHIPYEEVANAEGDKREGICRAINTAIRAIK